MKKFLAAAMAVMMIFFTACTQKKTPSVTEISEAVNSSGAYTGVDLIEIENSKLDIYFNGLDMTKVDSVYAAKAQDGYTDHFVVIKLKDTAYSDTVRGIFEQYKTSLADTYESYAPVEAQRARDGSVFAENDYYVFLIIAEDTAIVDNAIQKCFE